MAMPIFAISRIDAFTQLHERCITQPSNDADEEPGGDVYAHISLARDHSEPELQTGFQRQLW
jgi:hypothetical protein